MSNTVYHDFHCPVCGNKMDAWSFKFSLGDIIEKIVDSQDNYVCGTYDNVAYYSLIKDAKYFWNVSPNDMSKFKEVSEGGALYLRGKKMFAHYITIKPEISKLYDELKAASGEVSGGNGGSIMLNQFENPKTSKVREQLIDAIFSFLPIREIHDSGLSMQEIKNKISEIIDYALGGKLLFSANKITFTDEEDNMGNVIPTGLVIGGLYKAEIKKCSCCGAVLPNHAGKYKQKIISFMGSPYSGKSAFLTSVISKLRQYGSNIGLTLNTEENSPDYIKFKENLRAYEGGYSVTKTNETDFPQVSVDLKFYDSKLPSAKAKTYLYTFVDIPGEAFDLEIKDDINLKREIIRHSDILWYCLAAEQVFAAHRLDGDGTNSTDGNIFEIYGEDNKETLVNTANANLNDLSNKLQNFLSKFFKENERKPAIVLILTKNDKMRSFVYDIFKDSERNLTTCSKYLCDIKNTNGEAMGEPWLYTDAKNDNACVLLKKDRVDGIRTDIPDNSFIINKFSSMSRRVSFVSDFLAKYGSPAFNGFYNTLTMSFGVNGIIGFSVASYGREASTFNLAETIEILFKYVESKNFIYKKIAPIVNDLRSKYPDSEFSKTANDYIEADRTNSAKEAEERFQNRIISVIKSKGKPADVADAEFKQRSFSVFNGKDVLNELYRLHSRFNRLHTFGVLQPMVWSAAYTGLLPTVEQVMDGGVSVFKPIPENQLDYVQSVLRLNTVQRSETDTAEEKPRKKLFGIF